MMMHQINERPDSAESSRRALTARQRSTLETIVSFTDEFGYPPTVREIGSRVGLRSSSTVQAHINALERQGYLIRSASKTRSVVARNDPRRVAMHPFRSLPLLGSVAAGVPITAQENVEGDCDVPIEFARRGGSFMLRVKGDSMIDAGILDGDVIVVDRDSDASDGRIIVAMVDGDATVKRYFREGGLVRLQPENPMMKPIYAHAADLTILGIVTGCFHPL